ncbi:hypothetical protein VNI00_004315 [Paramarasmius palmivorus]|uniref:Cytochrome P450 n=1 Tax=Paramarasmius palmivorus TaxID=297713 RepID=A0AAW0DN26_9AGAR
MPQLIQSVASAACLAILFFVLRSAFHRFSRLPLPPGPPKLPLIGNLLQIPSTNQYEVYQRWGEIYDVSRLGVIHVDAVGNSIVILNTAKAAWDLLDKRSRIYSSRPAAPMVNDLMGWGWTTASQAYGETWRAHRRIVGQALNVNAVKIFRSNQVKATHFLLSRLLEDPESYFELLKNHSARIIMSIAYGLDVKLTNDPWVTMAEDALIPMMKALTPGAFLVNSLPFLKHVPSWLPGAGFKRKARKWKTLTDRFLHTPFAAAKETVLSGEYSTSFVSESLQRLDDDEPVRVQEQEDIIRQAAGDMYIGGADTTAAAMVSFLFAMLVNQDVQHKAQEEVDRVSSGRLPTFEDEKAMPYVTAVVWESLRWISITPLAVPHYSDAEDVYNGYRIPKGSVIVSNVWAILHDENMYPEPYDFKPERYFKPGTNEFNETIQSPTFAVFGFGRRICPGRHLGYASLWIGVVSLLKTFTISKARDKQGNIIEPVYDLRGSLVVAPRPFKCSITPRSAEAEGLILAANDEVEE